jgi:hypothetical protein
VIRGEEKTVIRATSQQEQMDEVQETAIDIVAFAQAAYDDLNDHLGAAQEGAG